jgi:alpha-1,3-rhamnosyl/mannosyltransferase
MRIALDGMLLGGHHSGVEQAIAGLIHALPQVAPEHEYLLACRREYAPDSPLPTLVAPGWAQGRLGRILYEQTRLARDLQGRCDLLHAPGYIMPLNWAGPCVLTVYDLIALQFPQLCTRTNVWHYGRMLPRSLRRADAIIVPSETVARDTRQVVPETDGKLHVIPLGIEEQYRPAPAAEIARVRRQYGLPERYLLCVGNIEPKKNLPAVLQAFDEAAATLPHDLVMAGRAAWRPGEFRAALASLRHRERVHVLGFVATADLPALYSAADLLIQWSLYEGMGLPPLEAMACGAPVLVSDGGALLEIAGPAAEVVPLGPPGQLAEALLALMANEARLAQLRQAGPAHAAQYTWTAHAAAVAQLYADVWRAGARLSRAAPE